MMKIVVSGGPHSGKTTLIQKLQTIYKDAYFVPEPAEIVITRELEKQAKHKGYAPIVPWLDYTTFGPEVTKESLLQESMIPKDAKLVFLDRCLIDTIAYCRLNDFESFIPDVQSLIGSADYTLAFFCEPVGDYRASRVRHEDAEEARRTHEFLVEAYEESAITLVHLPAASIERRILLLKQALKKLTPA